MKPRIFVSLVLLVVVGSAFLSVPAHSAATEVSPPGQMMVVTTNVQEVWGRADMRDQSELDNYVERLIDQLPYLPDVVLVQEVRLKSAKYIKNLLTETTGNAYGWGVRPPRRPWSQNPRKRTETDSAILVNTETVAKKDGGGYISLTYERRHATDKAERVEITQHARVSVEEKAGDLTLAGASVHMQYGHLQDRYVDQYQTKWTNKLARVMAEKYPNGTRVIAGDFNKDRCAERSGARNCEKAVFWKNLTGDRWSYTDSLFAVFEGGKEGVGLGGVDFIFTTGDPIDAGSDTSYNKSNPEEFYSDHRFYWTLIGS